MTSNDRAASALADCVAQLHEARRLVRALVPQGDQVCALSGEKDEREPLIPAILGLFPGKEPDVVVSLKL